MLLSELLNILGNTDDGYKKAMGYMRLPEEYIYCTLWCIQTQNQIKNDLDIYAKFITIPPAKASIRLNDVISSMSLNTLYKVLYKEYNKMMVDCYIPTGYLDNVGAGLCIKNTAPSASRKYGATSLMRLGAVDLGILETEVGLTDPSLVELWKIVEVTAPVAVCPDNPIAVKVMQHVQVR